MSSSISLSPVEDCQLYQKRTIFQNKGGKIKEIQIKTHEKKNQTIKYKYKCKWCSSKSN